MFELSAGNSVPEDTADRLVSNDILRANGDSKGKDLAHFELLRYSVANKFLKSVTR